MTKEKFLNQIRKHLSGIPGKEVEEILFDYEEHFRSGISEGRSEEEICASLGNPKTIAATIRADYYIDNAKNSYRPSDILSAVFAAAALGFFNIVFVLGPFCGFSSLLIGAWTVSFFLFLGGFGGSVLFCILSLLNPLTTGLSFTTVFFGLLSLGMTGIFMAMVCFYITRFFFRLTITYLKWNLDFIILRRKQNV